jgi:two-component SAPR family response regulator
VLFSKGTLNTSLPISKNIPKKDSSTIKSGVYLFGGFKIFNKSGKELTLAFSPKKKELFVLVLLYTFRKQGISSKEMANILWEGHYFESAKNNRSTQVQRLRETLEDNTGIRIEYMNKVWCIEMDEEVHWDFLSYQQLTQAFNNASDKEGALIIDELTQVINEGILLPHMHYEWLDPIKNQISEELILLLTPLFTEQKFNLDNNTLIRLTNVIFSFDSLNELALNYKIHLLQSEGRHVLAKNAYKEYCHAFFQFYNQEYSIKFSEWELS